MQGKIDDWHIARRGQAHDAAAYQDFLKEIGYLVPEPADFSVTTQNVDPEIASMLWVTCQAVVAMMRRAVRA